MQTPPSRTLWARIWKYVLILGVILFLLAIAGYIYGITHLRVIY
jgi:hypothetical protein